MPETRGQHACLLDKAPDSDNLPAMLTLRQTSLLVLAWLALALPLRAQWLVYEMQFKADADESVNFSFYTGGYLIAPIEGGAASIVLTTEDGGSRYAVSENTVRYFSTVNRTGTKAAISATAINGTAQAFYNASGYLNTTLGYTVGGVNRTARVATTLKGRLLAADDESLMGPAEDGSHGMVGSAVITATLRHDLSTILNAESPTMGAGIARITGLLAQYGYLPDVDDPAQPPAISAPASDVSELFGAHPAPAAGAPAGGAEATLFPPPDDQPAPQP